jgi:uncharacterized protein involved in outer membrane biogenesis
MKKVIIFVIIIALLLGGFIIYLNQVLLPKKLKALIVSGIEEATHKQVTLQKVRFSLFKGLVLENLLIYSGEKTLLRLKEGSCIFLFLPILQKKLIIPSLRLKSAEVFLERRADNTLNIQELLERETKKAGKAKFQLMVSKIRLIDSRLSFRDDNFTPPFQKDLNNLNMVIRLSLPASAKFDLRAEVAAQPLIKIKATGEYQVLKEKFTAKIYLKDFSPGEFSAYYRNTGLICKGGLVDASADLTVEKKNLACLLSLQNKNLSISKDKISLRLDAEVNSSIKFNLLNKELDFSGKALVSEAQMQGLDFIGEINGIKGEISFNQDGLAADKLGAQILGEPIQVVFRLKDFNEPLLNLNIISQPDLGVLERILREKFKIAIPAQIKGASNLSLTVETPLPVKVTPAFSGFISFQGAQAKIDKLAEPLKEISGRLNLFQNQLKWEGLSFKYKDAPYKTSGVITDFQSPGVQLVLSSQDIALQSNFAFMNQVIKFSKLAGRYLNSDFSATGDIDLADSNNPEADLLAELTLDLRDIAKPLKKYKDQLERIKPQGTIKAQAKLKGNLSDFKKVAIEAQGSGSGVSLYGLRSEELTMNYHQAEGIADIPLLHLVLYDGTLDANAKINFNSQNLPYWIGVQAQGIKLEKLKKDTQMKNEDISGSMAAQLKLSGFSDDPGKLSGTGKILVSEGKLWQLNLFKGLGSLLFAKDFSSIVFSEASCDFLIQDKYIFTENLKMLSDIADLEGNARIGFDTSLDISLNVKVEDENAPLTGTFKDITTAIIGGAGRFGVIRITGTIKEPKYKFQAAVVDIIKGIKDAIFGK